MRVRVSLLAALTAAALAPAACTIPPSGDYDCHITYGTTGPSSAAGSATCTPVTPPASPTPSATVTPTSSPVTTAPPSPTTAPPTTPPPATPSAVIAFPDASNTGVPDGVTLTAYTGPCTITAANTVIDAKAVNCDLSIQAAGVQISRSRIVGAVNTPDSLTTTAGFTLTDSEVSYPGITSSGRTQVGAANFTVLRTEVTGGNRGVYCRKNCTVRDSYVHGTVVIGTLHASALRMSQDATIVHNTLWCSAADAGEAGCSADLTGYGDFEPVTNNLIQDNLFHATDGGACAYGGSSGGKPYSGQASNIRFVDNVFERNAGGKCGFYFPVTDFDPSRPGNVWTGNTWADGGTVPPG